VETLKPLAARAAQLLKQRGETVAIAESSTAGLISAALLSVPGALVSQFFSAFCQRPHAGNLSFFLLAAFDLCALPSAISSA